MTAIQHRFDEFSIRIPTGAPTGHRCGLGEHRLDYIVVDIVGWIVLTRVLRRDGRQHVREER